MIATKPVHRLQSCLRFGEGHDPADNFGQRGPGARGPGSRLGPAPCPPPPPRRPGERWNIGAAAAAPFPALWGPSGGGARGAIQGVGAAWLMTTLAGTPDWWPWCRRRPTRRSCCWPCSPARWPIFGIGVGSCSWPWTVLDGIDLGSLGLVEQPRSGHAGHAPAVHLLIGMGAALTGPAWQASVREIVPRGRACRRGDAQRHRHELRPRGGPGGRRRVVAAAGAGAAFYLNAASTLVLAGRSCGGGAWCRATTCRASGSAAPS